jgi:branched-chain amino acid transport system substrate-binding protein
VFDVYRRINVHLTRSSWRAIGAAIFVALVIMPVWSCGRSGDSADKPTVVAILAITGPADFIGKPERAVLTALVEDHEAHGGLPFRLEVHDSGGVPEQARQIFTNVSKAPNVVAVIGPSTSGESIPLAMLAAELELPLLSLAASSKIVKDENDRTRDWAFKFAQNDDLAAQQIAAELQADEHHTAAFLYSNDGFGKSGANVFRTVIEESVVLRLAADPQAFDPAMADPEAVIETVPEAVPALVIWGTAPGPALLVQAAKRARPELQIYLSHGNASPAFIESAGPAAEGAIVVGSRVLLPSNQLNDALPADKEVRQFQRFWAGKFGTPPSQFAGYARDALTALIKVVGESEREGERPTGRTVRDRLEKLTSFAAVTGTYRFSPTDHAGLGSDAFTTYRIQSGAFTLARPE